MKRSELSWDKIKTGRCPECGTKVKTDKDDRSKLRCPVCESEYLYIVYPMDCAWTQTKKPTSIGEKLKQAASLLNRGIRNPSRYWQIEVEEFLNEIMGSTR